MSSSSWAATSVGHICPLKFNLKVTLILLSLCTSIDFDPIQTIPAHKYILATGSSVFYAMFYGGLAENKQEIKVPDVEPTAFLTLLRYVRTLNVFRQRN